MTVLPPSYLYGDVFIENSCSLPAFHLPRLNKSSSSSVPLKQAPQPALEIAAVFKPPVILFYFLQRSAASNSHIIPGDVSAVGAAEAPEHLMHHKSACDKQRAQNSSFPT